MPYLITPLTITPFVQPTIMRTPPCRLYVIDMPPWYFCLHHLLLLSRSDPVESRELRCLPPRALLHAMPTERFTLFIHVHSERRSCAMLFIIAMLRAYAIRIFFMPTTKEISSPKLHNEKDLMTSYVFIVLSELYVALFVTLKRICLLAMAMLSPICTKTFICHCR